MIFYSITDVEKNKAKEVIFLNETEIELFNNSEFGTVRTLQTTAGKIFSAIQL